MRELGADSRDYHAALAPILAKNGIDIVFTAGPLMAHLFEAIDPELRGGHAVGAGDLAPVGVGSRGTSLEVTRLRVYRDIYYIATRPWRRRPGEPITDYDLPGLLEASLNRQERADFLSDPNQWHVFAERWYEDFELLKDPKNPQLDQFFALGDNSPFSQDGRLWEGQHYVERRLLIGKALFVYWPHSWGKVPGTNIPLPMFPNFADMGMVR